MVTTFEFFSDSHSRAWGWPASDNVARPPSSGKIESISVGTGLIWALWDGGDEAVLEIPGFGNGSVGVVVEAPEWMSGEGFNSSVELFWSVDMTTVSSVERRSGCPGADSFFFL